MLIFYKNTFGVKRFKKYIFAGILTVPFWSNGPIRKWASEVIINSTFEFSYNIKWFSRYFFLENSFYQFIRLFFEIKNFVNLLLSLLIFRIWILGSSGQKTTKFGKRIVNVQLSKFWKNLSKMPVHKVANDADFTEKLNQGGTKLIVVDFSAAW